MTINMNDDSVVTISQIKEFLKLNNQGARFEAENRKERNLWIENVLGKFRYFSCEKKEKTIIKNYIARMIGLSKTQVKKLISRKRKFGKINLISQRRHCFERKYNPMDIALLVKTDNLHNRMSGQAIKRILNREYEIFNHQEYESIKNISVSHIYNLRETRQYQSRSLTIKKTNPTKILIGQRMKPLNQGLPGYLRVDTVHQGDMEKEKGVYHINIVDEVLQWEIIGCVERISEQYLKPLLEDLLSQFPFIIVNFHSDNGSEYINKMVAGLLNKLLVKQTKSRARHCNDNALVEGKNYSVIRKNIGYRFIAKGYATNFNKFYKEYFNVYLNYHRPCGYATITIDKRGKQKKKYDIYQTPYERLKSLPYSSKYLKPGIDFKILDGLAYSKSDNDFAKIMQDKKDELFNNFKGHKIQFPTVFSSNALAEISGSFID